MLTTTCPERARLACALVIVALAVLAGGRSAAAVACTGNAECDDGNACTDDVCDPTLGCLTSDNSAPCTDGNACTTDDVCIGGACVGGDRAVGCAACDAVATIPSSGGTFFGAPSGASTLTASCGSTGVSPERVYAWTPATSGTATVQTCGASNYDTVVYVRTDSCEGAQLVCNDDAPGCATTTNPAQGSRVTFSATAGRTYYLVVDGFDGRNGIYGLTVVPPATCGNGVREGAEECDGSDAADCVTGACTAGCACVDPPGGLPDLMPEITSVSQHFDTTVSQGDVTEGCAEATAGIDLLRFGVFSRNVGTAAFELGETQCPTPCDAHPLEVCGNPEFVCSPAEGHNHAHYQNYARYELLDAHGQALVVGHKQGFCLGDTECANPVYSCGFQGVSAGCADLYGPTLGCQYLDITGVPAGNYRIRVTLDPFHRIPELSNANNVAIHPVTITRPTGTATRTPTRTPTPARTPTPTRTATPASTTTRTATPAPTATSGAGACGDATVLPPGGGTFAGTTAGGSTLAGSCSQTGTAPEKVFRWTPATSGVASIRTCSATGTTYDTALYVRSGSCSAGSEVACNDDAAGCQTTNPNGSYASAVTPTVTAGVTYFIVVDGWNGQAGNFSLTVVPPAGAGATPTRTATPGPTMTPGGSPCSAPSVVPAAGGSFSGVTAGASTLRGACGVTSNSPEKVFQWTPARSGTAVLETCGSGYDTVLYLRAGGCTNGTDLACNDDTAGCGTSEPSTFHGSRISPTVTAGTTYFIVVDGFNGQAGSFSLRVTPP